VYRFGALDELGAVAYYAGRPEEGYHACKRLMEGSRVAPEHLERVQTNLQQYEQVMAQAQVQKMQGDMQSQVDKLKKRRDEKALQQKTTYKKKKAKSR
jgi:hypothetical protein